jgi:hypothetical protein
MIIKHPNSAHEKTCTDAEGARQQGVAVALAAGGGSATVAAAVKAAETAYYRAIIASCKANGIEASNFRQGLHDVAGVWE